MSLSTLLTKLGNARGALVAALNSQGLSVPSSATILSCAAEILNISAGADVTLGYIASGGQFQPVTFSGTSAADSGSAVTLSCYSWNTPAVSSGGTSSGSSGVSFSISSGQLISGATIDYHGTGEVWSGGTATNTTVNSGGYMQVRSGTANSVTVSSGGQLEIWSGGTATNVTSMTDAIIISSGGTITYA